MEHNCYRCCVYFFLKPQKIVISQGSMGVLAILGKCVCIPSTGSGFVVSQYPSIHPFIHSLAGVSEVPGPSLVGVSRSPEVSTISCVSSVFSVSWVWSVFLENPEAVKFPLAYRLEQCVAQVLQITAYVNGVER